MLYFLKKHLVYIAFKDFEISFNLIKKHLFKWENVNVKVDKSYDS